jgi:hypothetical protein
VLDLFGIRAFSQISAREVGSQTARQGFRNEDEIRDKFNNWRVDEDAQSWLRTMKYVPSLIRSVSARKPHGEKADVEVAIVTASGAAKKEGISIKLVSTATGFNQIDKRWVRDYARMWKMPPYVEEALKLFTGETVPSGAARAPNRMFLNELDPAQRKAVVDFFAANKHRIVSDVLAGEGVHAAGWMLVAIKGARGTRWTLRNISDVIRFYSEGDVVITRGGNLRIGRITMQRKGGDAGRDTAKMLQFKIDPTELFFAK